MGNSFNPSPLTFMNWKRIEHQFNNLKRRIWHDFDWKILKPSDLTPSPIVLILLGSRIPGQHSRWHHTQQRSLQHPSARSARSQAHHDSLSRHTQRQVKVRKKEIFSTTNLMMELQGTWWDLSLEPIVLLDVTLSETNLAPEHRPSQKETSIPTIHVQLLC